MTDNREMRDEGMTMSAAVHAQIHKSIYIHTYTHNQMSETIWLRIHIRMHKIQQAFGPQAKSKHKTIRTYHVYTHIHMCIHTFMHPYIHTSIHPYIQEALSQAENKHNRIDRIQTELEAATRYSISM